MALRLSHDDTLQNPAIDTVLIRVLLPLFLPTLLAAQDLTTQWNGLNNSWADKYNWSQGVPDESRNTLISVGSPTRSDPYVPAPFAGVTAATGNLIVQNGGHLDFDPSGVLVVGGTAKLLNGGSINLGTGSITFQEGVQLRKGGTFNAGTGRVEFDGLYFKNSTGSSFSPESSTVIFNSSSSFQWLGGYSSRWTREGDCDDDDERAVMSPENALQFFNMRALTEGTIYVAGNVTILQDCFIAPRCTLYVTFGSSFKVNGTISGGGTIVAFGAGSSLPVQLSSLNISSADGHALLQWTTATEVDNFGFGVERRAMDGSDWAEVGFVAGFGTSTSPHEYSFSDRAAGSGRFAYRLRQTDRSGLSSYFAAGEVVVGTAPSAFALGANYPNPFNPSTTIEFSVPEDGRASLTVYTLIGQKIATLFDGQAAAGQVHRVRFSAAELPSGLYFYKLQYNNQSIVRRMSLVK